MVIGQLVQMLVTQNSLVPAYRHHYREVLEPVHPYSVIVWSEPSPSFEFQRRLMSVTQKRIAVSLDICYACKSKDGEHYYDKSFHYYQWFLL